MLPRPMTTAMKPNVAPTPSWNARTAVAGAIPAKRPSARETTVIERKACSRTRAINTTIATTARNARSGRRTASGAGITLRSDRQAPLSRGDPPAIHRVAIANDDGFAVQRHRRAYVPRDAVERVANRQ